MDNNFVTIMKNNDINKSNSNIIQEDVNINFENLSEDDFLFYLNCIGGHSFFIEYKSKYLIKSAKSSEINFYKFLIQNNLSFQNIPKFYGIIEPTTKNYSLIGNYIKQLTFFIQKMIKKYKILSNQLEIGVDKKFNEKFNEFLNRKIEEIPLNKSFEKTEKQMNDLYKNSKAHLYWIFFCFIEWEKSFLIDSYIIITNFEDKIITPSILDLKIGREEKMSKKSGKTKIFKGACLKFGCRIMGISIGKKYFKNRYDTRDLSESEFIDELNKFFISNKENLPDILRELDSIKKFIIENISFKFDFASLLFILENNYNNNDIKNKNRVGLINIGLKNKEDIETLKAQNNNKFLINSSIIKCIDNCVGILKEF